MMQKSTLSEKLGMHPQLAIGYLGLLLFMIGDGVESGFLSPYLFDLQFSQNEIALVFTLYGAAAAFASWLSGVLSDLLGPKNVMWAGLLIWLVLEIPFLTLGLARHNYPIILLCYMIRGLGYPLFAFGFLVWVTAITPHRYLATSVGWFWFARTGGLPTLGSLFASYSVTRHGPYITLWYSAAFVALGGFIALLGIKEPRGSKPLRDGNEHPLSVLLTGISIIWKVPRVGLGGIVAIITTKHPSSASCFSSPSSTSIPWVSHCRNGYRSSLSCSPPIFSSISSGDGLATRLAGARSSLSLERVVARLPHSACTMYLTSSVQTTPMSRWPEWHTAQRSPASFPSEPSWPRSPHNHAARHSRSTISAPESASGLAPQSPESFFHALGSRASYGSSPLCTCWPPSSASC